MVEGNDNSKRVVLIAGGIVAALSAMAVGSQFIPKGRSQELPAPVQVDMAPDKCDTFLANNPPRADWEWLAAARLEGGCSDDHFRSRGITVSNAG